MPAGATEVGNLVVSLTGEGSAFYKMLQDASHAIDTTAEHVRHVGDQIEGFGKRLREFGKGIVETVEGFATAKEFLAKAFEAFSERESTMLRLSATLEINQRAVAETSEEYEKFANTMMEVNAIGEETTIALLTQAENFKMTGAAAESATQAAIGLAGLKGGSPERFMRLIGMLQQGGVMGMRATHMMRFLLPELMGVTNQSQLMARFQTLVNAGLDYQAKYANTARGALQKLHLTYTQFLGDLGKNVAEVLQPFAITMRELVNWFRSLPPEIKRVIVVITGVFASLNMLMGVFHIFKSLGINIFNPIVIAVTILAGVIASLVEKMGGITVVWKYIEGKVITAIAYIIVYTEKWRLKLIVFWNWLKNIAVLTWNFIKTSSLVLWEYLKKAATTVGFVFYSAWQLIEENWGSVVNAILGGVSYISNSWTLFKTAVAEAKDALWGLAKAALSWAGDFISNNMKTIATIMLVAGAVAAAYGAYVGLSFVIQGLISVYKALQISEIASAGATVAWTVVTWMAQGAALALQGAIWLVNAAWAFLSPILAVITNENVIWLAQQVAFGIAMGIVHALLWACGAATLAWKIALLAWEGVLLVGTGIQAAYNGVIAAYTFLTGGAVLATTAKAAATAADAVATGIAAAATAVWTGITGAFDHAMTGASAAIAWATANITLHNIALVICKIATWALTVAVIALKVALVATFAVALIAPFVAAIVLGFLTIKAAISAVTAFISAFVSTLMHSVVSIGSSFVGLGTMLGTVVTGLAPMFGSLLGQLGKVIQAAQIDMPTAFKLLKAVGKLAVEELKAVWSPLWTFLQEGFAAFWKDLTFRSKRAMAEIKVSMLSAFADLPWFVPGAKSAKIAYANAVRDLMKLPANPFDTLDENMKKAVAKFIMGINTELGGKAVKEAQDAVDKIDKELNKLAAQQWSQAMYGGKKPAGDLQTRAKELEAQLKEQWEKLKKKMGIGDWNKNQAAMYDQANQKMNAQLAKSSDIAGMIVEMNRDTAQRLKAINEDSAESTKESAKEGAKEGEKGGFVGPFGGVFAKGAAAKAAADQKAALDMVSQMTGLDLGGRKRPRWGAVAERAEGGGLAFPGEEPTEGETPFQKWKREQKEKRKDESDFAKFRREKAEEAIISPEGVGPSDFAQWRDQERAKQKVQSDYSKWQDMQLEKRARAAAAGLEAGMPEEPAAQQKQQSDFSKWLDQRAEERARKAAAQAALQAGAQKDAVAAGTEAERQTQTLIDLNRNQLYPEQQKAGADAAKQTKDLIDLNSKQLYPEIQQKAADAAETAAKGFASFSGDFFVPMQKAAETASSAVEDLGGSDFFVPKGGAMEKAPEMLPGDFFIPKGKDISDMQGGQDTLVALFSKVADGIDKLVDQGEEDSGTSIESAGLF
jgi:hypothetical protein